ncbi:uncharacterized protein K452DRAFT_44114 [Aplosporella prunicola CBS 121167]|uniref:Uncharacterized protein n=1 Tax=Aplosporella prunicola CBS 121167 TaxID=1176127 RepID=A0A6A6BAG8_9PEZI|nr:uncharacterized protein K452DRAFT_44114 [Aplosporella prunicola CBS 121167]KAF2141016.1 hypothetical protein K452DRAFT_44114 [Aplosporella prunicola CBS 121167]
MQASTYAVQRDAGRSLRGRCSRRPKVRKALPETPLLLVYPYWASVVGSSILLFTQQRRSTVARGCYNGSVYPH